MSATRLLVLGVVRRHDGAHGYLVRNELLSWGIEDWTNVKWGSIYHALKKLAAEGLLAATEVPDCRTDYRITPEGEAEFLRLLRDALRRPDPRADSLSAALALLPALPRAEAVALLRERLAVEETSHTVLRDSGPHDWEEPGDISELVNLWSHTFAAGAEWTRDLIARLEEGAYTMSGDPGAEEPPGAAAARAAEGRRLSA
ncbi:PadR family transcriptional regulator [Allonocardiopsis opalescens]|uniref:PadR family transcriptional regulator n=1 Tax=Allonocardiopsis opalescens TaxID=1144618 RepID=A0A2T0PZ69_9ACTN|nr:PadR family transcriptional regulator [Allonocardiopsis opalescens]PRX96821.1 PadR family transcriptional regulator [Allonocardiopsis opalescens]